MGGFLFWGRFTSLRPYAIESCVTRQSKIGEALVAAGKLLGISVLDHVIIGDGTSAYFSFAYEGLLERS
jgi:hypothetical protein